jgi:hypothetical protein
MSNWSKTVSPDLAYRRAGGRRRYNAQRQQARDARREQIKVWILADERPCVAANRTGTVPRLARMFGVHRSTITRDLAVIRDTLVLPDPCCEMEAEMQRRERIIHEASWRPYLGLFPSPQAVEQGPADEA